MLTLPEDTRSAAYDALAPDTRKASEPVLIVEHVSKRYEIYERPQDRLKQSLMPRLQALLPATLRRSQPFYKEFWALRDVSLTLGRGEALGILGQNGAGKSTLLQIIAGTLSPTSGKVSVRGKVAALLELGSGFSPDFTGRENVRLNAALLGLSTDEIGRRFDEIAAFADIGDFIEQPVKTYSSGMMMRLAFAVQTVIQPELLIVDEALSVGDARFQKKCFSRLEQLRENGTTILLVTHDTGTAVQFCSKAVIIEKGQIYSQGEPQSISRQYHRLLFSEKVSGSAEGSTRRSASDVGVQQEKRSDDHADPNPLVSTEGNGAPKVGVDEVRYGSREVEVLSIGLRNGAGDETRVIEIHDHVEFYCVVRFNQDISEPVAYGFIIANTRGVEVYGTKAALFDMLLPPSPAGTQFECCLRLKISAAPGPYFLTVALAHDDSQDQSGYYDYRFDALKFQVVGLPRCFTTSMVDFDANLDVRKLN